MGTVRNITRHVVDFMRASADFVSHEPRIAVAVRDFTCSLRDDCSRGEERTIGSRCEGPAPRVAAHRIVASTLVNTQHHLNIPGLATVVAGRGGLPMVRVTSSHAAGEMYLHGGHVTSWIPAGGAEVLFVSRLARFEEGRAIRGGVPVSVRDLEVAIEVVGVEKNLGDVGPAESRPATSNDSSIAPSKYAENRGIRA